LLLVVYGSRQRISISLAWMFAVIQTVIAAMGAVFVGWVVQLPYRTAAVQQQTLLQKVSGATPAVGLAVGLLIWAIFLVWLLLERNRYNRHGPTASDGLRSNTYR